MKNLILIFAILVGSFAHVFAQDIIELKSGETLEVRITKIGQEAIEFRPYKIADQAVIAIDKFLIESYKFEFSDSKTAVIAEKVTNVKVEDLYDDKIHYAFKTQPLQMISSNFKIAYEQSISYNQSFEAEVGLRTTPFLYNIDLERPMTFYSTLRYKTFYRPSSLKMTDTGRSPLHGLYVAPVLSFGSSQSTDSFISFTGNPKKAENLFGAIMVDLGYQAVIGNAIVDGFIGVGLSGNTENTDLSFNNSHTALGPGAIRTGFRIGISSTK